MPTVYKPKDKKSQFFQTDIWIDGRKFSRSTGCKSRSEAKARARELEIELRADLAAQATPATGMTLDAVAGRYMLDVGDRHAGADNTRRLCALLVKHFGATKLITEITHEDVLGLRRWRIGHKYGTPPRPVSPYTVNDTIEQLKKLFTYLRPTVRFPNEPKWKDLWLDEPPRPIRELGPDATRRLDAAIDQREDYEPLFEFCRATAKRKIESLTLAWSSVNWDTRIITMRTKGRAGGKISAITISDAIREILWPLWQRRHENCGVPDAADRVFTFVAQRTRDGRVAGKRYPITKDGLRRVWNNIRAAAGLLVGDDRVRFHDLRHDTAKKALRAIGTAEGFPIVQRMLDHADVSTTLNIYGAANEQGVADVIDKLAQQRKAARATGATGRQTGDKNHRRNHRSRKAKTA
jgi:integrase